MKHIVLGIIVSFFAADAMAQYITGQAQAQYGGYGMPSGVCPWQTSQNSGYTNSTVKGLERRIKGFESDISKKQKQYDRLEKEIERAERFLFERECLNSAGEDKLEDYIDNGFVQTIVGSNGNTVSNDVCQQVVIDEPRAPSTDTQQEYPPAPAPQPTTISDIINEDEGDARYVTTPHGVLRCPVITVVNPDGTTSTISCTTASGAVIHHDAGAWETLSSAVQIPQSSGSGGHVSDYAYNAYLDGNNTQKYYDDLKGMGCTPVDTAPTAALGSASSYSVASSDQLIEIGGGRMPASVTKTKVGPPGKQRTIYRHSRGGSETVNSGQTSGRPGQASSGQRTISFPCGDIIQESRVDVYRTNEDQAIEELCTSAEYTGRKCSGNSNKKNQRECKSQVKVMLDAKTLENLEDEIEDLQLEIEWAEEDIADEIEDIQANGGKRSTQAGGSSNKQAKSDRAFNTALSIGVPILGGVAGYLLGKNDVEKIQNGNARLGWPTDPNVGNLATYRAFQGAGIGSMVVNSALSRGSVACGGGNYGSGVNGVYSQGYPFITGGRGITGYGNIGIGGQAGIPPYGMSPYGQIGMGGNPFSVPGYTGGQFPYGQGGFGNPYGGIGGQGGFGNPYGGIGGQGGFGNPYGGINGQIGIGVGNPYGNPYGGIGGQGGFGNPYGGIGGQGGFGNPYGGLGGQGGYSGQAAIQYQQQLQAQQQAQIAYQRNQQQRYQAAQQMQQSIQMQIQQMNQILYGSSSAGGYAPGGSYGYSGGINVGFGSTVGVGSVLQTPTIGTTGIISPTGLPTTSGFTSGTIPTTTTSGQISNPTGIVFESR